MNVPRKTLPSGPLECVGGPFDGDAIACELDACVEVAWGGVHQGTYMPSRRRSAQILRWIPAGAD